MASLSAPLGDAPKDVIGKRLHDTHSCLNNAGVGVELLEYLVDVSRVGFSTLLAVLLLVVDRGLGSLRRSLVGGCFNQVKMRSCF